MRNRRTTVDFSRHVLTVKKDSLAEIFEFKRPDTINYSIKFILLICCYRFVPG